MITTLDYIFSWTGAIYGDAMSGKVEGVQMIMDPGVMTRSPRLGK